MEPFTARFSSGGDAGRTAASTQALLTAPLTPRHRLPSTDSTTSLPSTDGTVTPTAATPMSLPPSSTGHTPAATGGGPTGLRAGYPPSPDLPAAVEEGDEAEAEAGGYEVEGTRSGLTRGTVVVDAGAPRQPRQPLVRGGLSRAAGNTPPGGSGGGISRAPPSPRPSAGSFLDSAIVSDDTASSIALNTTSLYALTSVAGDGARKAAGGQGQAEGASESESETPAGRGRRTTTLV